MKKLIISSVVVGVMFAVLFSLLLLISGVTERWFASFFEGVVLGTFWCMLDIPRVLCAYKPLSLRYFLSLAVILTATVGSLLLLPSWWVEGFRDYNMSLGWALGGFVVSSSLIFCVKELYKLFKQYMEAANVAD
ncbi:MAG: hypothetical protein G01um101413_733 [Parcubacteria group bacterium Gr01-1014_13]|nr:MAG: hypothetical protein G01um101413_733 [Parcubacteria group bacterium Gr01-1014_13]